MKKVVVTGLCFAVVVGFALVLTSDSANARPQYKKSWDKLYMTDGSAMAKALGGKSNCNVCHDGKDKKKRNDYGMALGKLTGKNLKDADKIEADLKKVAGMHSKGDDSPTFGKLIEEGKLPITK